MEIYQQRPKGPRACSTCAKAKARCIPGPDASKCERCHRLNKLCPSQTPAPPRRRKEPKTTRVAELEKRLEDLTSRIELAQKQQHQPQMPTPPESADSLGATGDAAPISGSPSLEQYADGNGQTSLQYDFPAVLGGMPTGNGQAPLSVKAIHDDLKRRTNAWNITNTLFGDAMADRPAAATAQPAPMPLHPPKTAERSIWPTGTDADALLHEYRCMERLQLFPFVVVPAGLTSEQLRQQRPFLWKAVMMEACHLDGSRQITLGNQLLKDVSEAAFTKPQKTIDLLQGMQMLISSFHYNLNSFQMTNLLYLARSICMSLNLSQVQGGLTKHGEPTAQCLEQMRAFAGTYYLVTVIFTTNKKPDALMNTSYLETCCRILETRMEYDTDELLVWLVRTQQLAQSISLTLAVRATAAPSNLPMSLIIKSLQQQLATFRDSLPHHMKTNPSLVGHQHVAEILLYEIGLQENLGLPVTDRLDYLWSLVRAAQSFFANKFAASFTENEQPQFICMCSFDFIYAFLMVLKLVTLQLPGWDLQLVRKELNFDYLVDKQIQEMECLANRRLKVSSARATAEGQAPEGLALDPYRKLAEKLKMLRDALCGQLDADFNDKLAEAAEAGAMTITDATQGIVEDLEGSLWQSLMGAAADWDSFDAVQGFIF